MKSQKSLPGPRQSAPLLPITSYDEPGQAMLKTECYSRALLNQIIRFHLKLHCCAEDIPIDDWPMQKENPSLFSDFFYLIDDPLNDPDLKAVLWK